MEDIRYSKQFLDTRPIGRRRPGRTLKRLLDGYRSDAETGNLLAGRRKIIRCRVGVFWWKALNGRGHLEHLRVGDNTRVYPEISGLDAWRENCSCVSIL
jgi:hypothetical protein